MRTRNREINIFNMSLLDVLSGALGAFMFMMLSFVPYYNIVIQNKLTPTEQQKEKEDLKDKLAALEQKNRDLDKRIEDLTEALTKAGKGDVTAEELAKLEEENNRLRKEIEKLKAENEKLRAENAELQARLDSAEAEISRLKQEIAELRERLARIKPGNPEAEAMLLQAQTTLFALSRAVFISAEVDGDELFELLLRDPKGAWFDATSNFPFGVKSSRVTAFSGWDAQEITERDARHNVNAMYLDVDSLLVPGEYLIGVRHTGLKNRKESGVFERALAASPSPAPSASPSTVGWLGVPPVVHDAFAQSDSSNFRGSPTSDENTSAPPGYPKGVSRPFIRGMARILRSPMRQMITPMPVQTIPVSPWVSVLARIRVSGGEINFQWFERLAEDGSLTGLRIPGLADAALRQQLERRVNSGKIEPLRETKRCFGPNPCTPVEDPRGNISKEDLDPVFRDTIDLHVMNTSGASPAPAGSPTDRAIATAEREKILKEKAATERAAAEGGK